MMSEAVTPQMAGPAGGEDTVTVNAHEACLSKASVAVALTVVTPTGKTDPLTGCETTEIGSVPPLTVNGGYETAIPEVVCAVTL